MDWYFFGGLNIIEKNTNKIIVYKHNKADHHSIPSNQVLKITFDSDTTCYLACYGGGIIKCNINSAKSIYSLKFENIITPLNNNIYDNRFYTFLKISDTEFLIGTFGGGLTYYNNYTKKVITYKYNPKDKTSLSENRVLTIYKSSLNDIWVGTFGGGLNKFDLITEKIYSFH
jgi:ligand-binding sensor domain-containing protein